MSINETFHIYSSTCKSSRFGKIMPEALYIHVSALPTLDPLLLQYEAQARNLVPPIMEVNIIKFKTNQLKISYLSYPDFDTDPHPALKTSIQVNLVNLKVTYRDYSNSPNPPILHRKETFVTPDYPLYEQFSLLTHAQERLGLLDNPKDIGNRQGWVKRLQTYGVVIEGHCLKQQSLSIVEPEEVITVPGTLAPQIDRHKAAITRYNLSRPVRLALEAGLFTSETSFLDYGCGRGGDVKQMKKQGYTCSGWDPFYSPEPPPSPADIVNLGYVINVIENIGDRREALLKAWELTRKVLIVAAQVTLADINKGTVIYGDGIVTNRKTFQKYYEQEELKIYIDQLLGVDAIPVALGVYFVFRDPVEAQLFRLSRFRSRASTPRVRACIKLFADHQELLVPLMSFMTKRGRLPHQSELPEAEEINAEFGNFRRAFQVILQVTEAEEWEAITKTRRQDLMVYLALCEFTRRPKFAEFAPEIREDILGLFGTYKQALLEADEMLHSLGNSQVIREIYRQSRIGKKSANHLLVHISALRSLDPLLRLYEGCASRTIGRLDEANVIKFYLQKPKIAYLFYPDFDIDPHPVLQTSMEINLSNLHVTYRDYSYEDSSFILHYKDALVTPDYPLYEKFAKLTRQEEDWGLLDNWPSISDRAIWLQCLTDNCVILKGYQLSWRKDADPYKIKLLRAAVQNRRQKNRY